MLIAFVTDELPRPGAAGHLALNHAIITWAQSEGHEVRVLLVGSRLPAPVVQYGIAPVVGRHIAALGPYLVPRQVRPAVGLMLRYGLNILPQPIVSKLKKRRNAGADAVLGSFTTVADAAWCAAYLRHWRADAMLVDTIFRTPVINALQPHEFKTILVAHDVFFRRHLALSTAGYRVAPAALSAATEAGFWRLADHVAAIQPEEAALMGQSGARVFLLPMPAVPVPRPAGTERLANRLVFTGSASLPNLDGLRWFLAEIWPLLAGQGIALDIAGDAGPALGALPEGVTALGRVKNLAPLLHSASLAIAPLRAGSGLKIKMLDYARHGLTTIATSCSLEGFAADDHAVFIRADTAAEFAATIRQALLTPIADEPALAYVTRHYGLEPSFVGLRNALHGSGNLAATVPD